MKDITHYFVDPVKSNESCGAREKGKRGNADEGGKVNGRNSRSEGPTNERDDNDSNPEASSKGNVVTVDLSFDSDDEMDSQREESNAFQILMSHTKTTPSSSPTKSSQDKEPCGGRRSDESRDRSRKAKEKLIALADKKGYSKRKLVELEEAERIEKTIEDRVKSFKLEERKENAALTANANHQAGQRQTSGSLLNYFSKIPPELASKEMTTFVVKADVHMSENSVVHTSQKASNRRTETVKRNRKPDVKLSDLETISVIASENINVLADDAQEECPLRQRSKRQWSLRIKLHSSEDQNPLNGETSDEEIFSPRCRRSRTSERLRKLESSKSLEETVKSESRRSTKQVQENAKSRIGKREQEKKQDTSQNLKDKSNNLDANAPGTDREYDSSEKQKENHEDYSAVSDNSQKRKSNKKLAPLFTKRRKPDPEILAARRLFLQPENPENEGRNTERKVNNTCNTLPFPTISHVAQSTDLSFLSNDINIPLKRETPYVPRLDISEYKYITDRKDERVKESVNIDKVKPQNIESLISEIEKRCSGARTMWDNISMVLKQKTEKRLSPKGKNRKRRSNETNKEDSPRKETTESTLGTAWTCKYKPTSTKEIVGNEEAAGKLRDWLDGWRSTLANGDGSSGDEFYTSDCSNASATESNQVAVLLGPHGSGKSASVYAVAAELGYTVLEVNASTRRTGKKLLKELEEATKSHRIKKDKGAGPPFKPVSNEATPKKLPQNSLILLEDIDLLFEEDEGFVSATYQLASNTKRPIVMTTRNVCPHLNKMAPQQNRIYFQSVCGNRVAALLELISLAETGYRLSPDCIEELLQAGDLRKALLQLQYLLLSGTPQISEECRDTRYSFWQNIRYSVYKPAIRSTKRRRAKKSSKSERAENASNTLNNLADKLDSIALISSLTEVEDAALNLSRVSAHPNLSLAEDTSAYSGSRDTSTEIADWMAKSTFSRDQQNSRKGSSGQNSFLLRKQLNTGVDLALSNVTSFLLDQKVLSVDYLPSVRAICRAEEQKASTNLKRGKRFFHYLHNSRAPLASLKPNILAAACKALQDKKEEEIVIT